MGKWTGKRKRQTDKRPITTSESVQSTEPSGKCKLKLPHPRQLTVIKKSDNQRWGRCGEKGTLNYWWWGESVWRFTPKLKIELPYDPALSLLTIFPENPHPTTEISAPCAYCCFTHCSKERIILVVHQQRNGWSPHSQFSQEILSFSTSHVD